MRRATSDLARAARAVRSAARPVPFRISLTESSDIAGLVLVARAQLAAITRIRLVELPLAFEIPLPRAVTVFASRLTPVGEAWA